MGRLSHGNMQAAQQPLPDFDNPPVVEVVLSVQFEALPQLGISHIGLIWDKYRKQFPVAEHRNVLNPTIEEFEGNREAQIELRVTSEPPVPRCWFHNLDRTGLIQIQRDRFIFNWRSGDGATSYPRYPSVKRQFERYFKQFRDFVREEQLGRIIPNQCEVTYVNHIFWEGNIGHGEAAKRIFPMISGQNSDAFLPTPEELYFRTIYQLKDSEDKPLGRLHISAQPRIQTTDGSPLYRLDITARGAPLKPTNKGISEFFDLGREHVVRGFASITSAAMHKQWGRTDAK